MEGDFYVRGKIGNAQRENILGDEENKKEERKVDQIERKKWIYKIIEKIKM